MPSRKSRNKSFDLSSNRHSMCGHKIYLKVVNLLVIIYDKYKMTALLCGRIILWSLSRTVPTSSLPVRNSPYISTYIQYICRNFNKTVLFFIFISKSFVSKHSFLFWFYAGMYIFEAIKIARSKAKKWAAFLTELIQFRCLLSRISTFTPSPIGIYKLIPNPEQLLRVMACRSGL
jgi:hypothetical protein